MKLSKKVLKRRLLREYIKQRKSKFNSTRDPKATTAATKKKKRRRRKKNETVGDYYEMLSASNEEWMKFVDPEEIEKAFNPTNITTTTTYVNMTANMTNTPAIYVLNEHQLRRKLIRRMNKTARTTTKPLPHRLVKKQKAQKRTTARTQENSGDTRQDESEYESTEQDESGGDLSQVEESTKENTEQNDQMDSSRVQKSSQKYKEEESENKKTTINVQERNKMDSKEVQRSSQKYKEESENKKITINVQESKRTEVDQSEWSEIDDGDYKDDLFSKEATKTKANESEMRTNKPKKIRKPRAIDNDQSDSGDSSNDTEDSPENSDSSVEEIKTKKYTSTTARVTMNKLGKKKKQRTLSILEAKQRRLERKNKTKIQTTTRKLPEFIAKYKEAMKKELKLTSQEMNEDELIVRPDLTTKYTPDVDKIQKLLESVNNTSNEKLFFNLMKDLEETGTVKQDLQREIITEISKKAQSTRASTTITTTVEQKTSSTVTEKQMRSTDMRTTVPTTTQEKTKRTKVKTTFPLYVDGFSAERVTFETKQSKKVLHPKLTTKKKSIHEILGITTKPPHSAEVLNSEERREFLHDAYFDYGMRGPVKQDILVSSTRKHKIKTTRFKVERKITTDKNEIEIIKKKVKDLDLKHMLGSQADYYDEMKRIMDDKTMGKDTQERYMQEWLLRKYGEDTQTTKQEEIPLETERNTIVTRPVTSTSTTLTTESPTNTPVPDYYFPPDKPIFKNLYTPDVEVITNEPDTMEREVQEYNKQLLEEENQENQQDKVKTRTEAVDDTSTMEQRSEFKAILQHYLTDDTKEKDNPISQYMRNLQPINSTTESKQTPVSLTTLAHVQTAQRTSLKLETLTHKPIIISTNSLKKSSDEEEEDKEYKDAILNKLREDLLKNPNNKKFEEVKLDSAEPHENEEDKAFSKELDKIIDDIHAKDERHTTGSKPTTRASITRIPTRLPPPDTKEIEEIVNNKEEHFEKVLGDFMKKHTETTRPPRLRGRSTKIVTTTTRRTVDDEWGKAKDHCPAFMNQSMFDTECQKFIRMINKRGENQLQRLDFEMKTKNNQYMGQLVSKNILTANHFANIIKRSMKKPCDLASEILYAQVTPRILDPQATEKYKSITGNIISKCGYFIDDKYPFLGALPDGLIDNDGMVKFVNTSTYPNIDLRTLLLRDKNLRSNFIVDKNITLVPYGKLMYEIQGELHVTKRHYCDLFVYNGNDQLLLKIAREKDFWKQNMRKPLIDFYRTHMMPAIVKRLLHRRYKIYPDGNYLLNSDEDILSVIRGLRSDTTQQTLPTKQTQAQPVTIPNDEDNEGAAFDSRKIEEEWENLHRKTIHIPFVARTIPSIKKKSRNYELRADKSREQRKRNKIYKNWESRSKEQRKRKDKSEDDSKHESDQSKLRSKLKKKVKPRRSDETKSQASSESKSDISKKKKRKKYSSLESLYESQERHRKIKLKEKPISREKDIEYRPKLSRKQYASETFSAKKGKEKYHRSLEEERSISKVDKKLKGKYVPQETSEEIHSKYKIKKKSLVNRKEKNYRSHSKQSVSREAKDSSENMSSDKHVPRKQREHSEVKKIKRKKLRETVESAESSQSESKSKIKKRRRKIVKRDATSTDMKSPNDKVIGKRVKRDLPALPKEHKKDSSDYRVTIENLYSYKDTEYKPASYDPNESVFRSLPQRIEKKRNEPDLLVHFYKKGLIGREEFLEIVKNKTREGKPWRRDPSVESSKTFETENYSDLVKLINNEPLSGIKQSITEDPVEYDKDDLCKKYMRNIGYGRPIDDGRPYNKSIVFTADDIKRLKQEKLERKLARAKAKRKITGRKRKDSDISSIKKKVQDTLKAKKRKSRVKGKRRNDSLSIDDLSLGDEDIDEVTKKKGRWKTTPGYDMYNLSHRAHRRKWFPREYRAYWENLSKLKRLYPSAEDENPDAKLSDRFYRALKVERAKQRSEEYLSIRDCRHSYSTEFREEREKREKILRRKYADENTAEILRRLGKRLVRKKKTETDKAQSSDKLLDVVKEELLKRTNLTNKRTVRSVRKKRSASMMSGEMADPKSTMSNQNVSEQESIETAMRKALKGEDEIFPSDRTTITYTTDRKDRCFSREKKRRARRLRLKPKYADISSAEMEFVLLKKELKKNGEDFSYLSVSITDELQGVTEVTNDDDDLDLSEKSGFYVTKPTKVTVNDDEALMNILKEKSEEDKLLNNNENNQNIEDNESSKTPVTRKSDIQKASTLFNQTSLSNPKKKRGRPPKQNNSTKIKKKRTQSKKNSTIVNRRRKRSIEESKKKRKLPLKTSRSESSQSSRVSESSQDIQRKVRKNKDRLNVNRKPSKSSHPNTGSASDETVDSSDVSSESKDSHSVVEKRRHKHMNKDVDENSKKYKIVDKKESQTKKKHSKESSSEETDERESSSRERLTRKQLDKKKEKRKDKLTESKYKRKSNSNEYKSKSSSSDRKSSSESAVSETQSSSESSEKKATKKPSRKKLAEIKKEFRAKQRKLRRKERKLLKKKLKKQNVTGSMMGKTTIKKGKKLKTPNIPVTKPYTPRTIQIRFTKDPRKYRKLPTRDVESIFDHQQGRYEEFLREYNLRHSCTPLSKRAIKKLEIIKQQEFNQKQANKTIKEDYKQGFDSYDSHDFDNNVERKHKPWESLQNEEKHATAKKKIMPWDPEYKSDDEESTSLVQETSQSKQEKKKSSKVKSREKNKKYDQGKHKESKEKNKSFDKGLQTPKLQKYEREKQKKKIAEKSPRTKHYKQDKSSRSSQSSEESRKRKPKTHKYQSSEEESDETKEYKTKLRKQKSSEDSSKDSKKRRTKIHTDQSSEESKDKRKHKTRIHKQHSSEEESEGIKEYKTKIRKQKSSDDSSTDSRQHRTKKHKQSSEEGSSKESRKYKTKVHKQSSEEESEETKERQTKIRKQHSSEEDSSKDSRKHKTKIHKQTSEQSRKHNTKTYKAQTFQESTKPNFQESTKPQTNAQKTSQETSTAKISMEPSIDPIAAYLQITHPRETRRESTEHDNHPEEHVKNHEKHAKHPEEEGSSADYLDNYSNLADTEEGTDEGPDLADESFSKIRREMWKMDQKRQQEPTPRPGDMARDARFLHREKRTLDATEANVINMNPLLLITEGTKKKRKKTTRFRREKTPWHSKETTSTTMSALRKRFQRKLNQILRNTNRYLVNSAKNYTSVAEARGLLHLLDGPNSTYTTATPEIDREIEIDHTIYRVTDLEIYNIMAAKLLRDDAEPNKRKSQFRHSQHFFERLLSTTPNPSQVRIQDEMSRYWKEKEEEEIFLYRCRDGRNHPSTDLYNKRMAEGKRWRLMARMRSSLAYWGQGTSSTKQARWTVSEKNRRFQGRIDWVET
ncbi:hypothetical protein M8J77_012973 [Diaphorina citri]|nr:hypothetical protein M8J77_005308 [Diaphorina citri]KAI5725247.1 hypothetical protein M8J77_012973 [Diaphorina citri]